MDAKNLEALAEFGPEWILGKLTNLPNSTADRESVARFKRDYGSLLRGKEARPLAVAVEEFREKYGELYPGMGVTEYAVCAKIFQGAWLAKTARDREHLGQHITAIFEREEREEVRRLLPSIEIKDRDDPRLRPGIVVDFELGKVAVKPRTLLDSLAKSLLECRDKLAVCERKRCEHPYFLKVHARQRFCSHDCANSVRQQKKAQWWAENRERFLKKWRQERKASRRRKWA